MKTLRSYENIKFLKKETFVDLSIFMKKSTFREKYGQIIGEVTKNMIL
jgi:hypothetical protein